MTVKQFFGNSGVLMLLIGINVAVAILIAILAVVIPGEETFIKSLLVLPAAFSDFISRPWTPLTYMFTQFSFLHLLFNLLWLLWFGRVFLYCSSEKRLLVAYVGGGLTGAVLFLIVCGLGGTGMGSYLTGSSASVLAVMTAAAIMAPNLELNMLLLGPVRLKYVALFCIALTFIGIGGGNAGGLSAHFGGILFGLLLPSLSPSTSYVPSFMEQLKRIRYKLRSSRQRKIPDAFNAAVPPRKTPSKAEDEERLDQLLDKVRVSGYDSLSSSEKIELNAISKRL